MTELITFNHRASPHFVVDLWMAEKLMLKGNELMVYAIIHGFSQDKKSGFYGSVQYLCNFVGCSRSTMMDCLKSLIVRKYIVQTKDKKGIKYFCNMDEFEPGEQMKRRNPKIRQDLSENTTHDVVKYDNESPKIRHNNIVYTIEDNIEDSIDYSLPNNLINNVGEIINESASAETEEDLPWDDTPNPTSQTHEKDEKPFISDLTNFYYPVLPEYLPIQESPLNRRYTPKYPPLLPQHGNELARWEELMALNPTKKAQAQVIFELECWDKIDWYKVYSTHKNKPVPRNSIDEELITDWPESKTPVWMYLGLKCTLSPDGKSLSFKEIKVPVYSLKYLKKQTIGNLKAFLKTAIEAPNYYELLQRLILEKTNK